jgi:chromosomal replication initiator protein
MDHYTLIEKQMFWDRFLKLIEESVNVQSYNTWFKSISLADITDSNIVISVPKAYFSSWLEEHYLPLLKSSSLSILGREYSFSFISEDNKESLISEIASPDSIDEYTVPASTIKFSGPSFIEQLSINERFTFDTFVVGNSNQFAYAAAKAVAESPGSTAFNPLVIYGGVGLGKTHLLQAIALHCMKTERFFKDTSKIIYVSSEKFTMDFIMSIQNNLINEYSKYYRSADILLVDDIQFFNNKERTQEEFFHIFNTLHQQGKQIVLSMDNPPNQIKGLADRLINRFQWGLVTDIQPPDFETRIAILNKKASADGVYLDPAIASFIAEHITSNIRELEGSLIRLLAYSSLYGKDLSLEMATSVLGDTIRKRTSIITIEFIQKLTAEHFSIPLTSLIGNSRRKEVAIARHLAIYLAKQLTDSSLKTIGLHFGGRDHSTIIHSLHKVEKELPHDPIMADHIETIARKAKSF